MKFKAKVTPEGINTSRRNPLKELFLLITASLSIVPGRHIFISTALLNNVDSENGLAMVLAHEMAHQCSNQINLLDCPWSCTEVQAHLAYAR
jgi:Zn-dependent protease with chaperone function